MTERNVGVPATAAVAPQPEHTDGWRALGLALLLFVLVVLGLSTAFWWWTHQAPANFMIAGVDQDASAQQSRHAPTW
ncbi:MAG: hypothetical protein R2873_16215 [Caldilineaceae bacterium]